MVAGAVGTLFITRTWVRIQLTLVSPCPTPTPGNLVVLIFVAGLVAIPILADHDQAAAEETLFAHRTRGGQRPSYVVLWTVWFVVQSRLFFVPAAILFATGGLLLSLPLTSTNLLLNGMVGVGGSSTIETPVNSTLRQPHAILPPSQIQAVGFASTVDDTIGRRGWVRGAWTWAVGVRGVDGGVWTRTVALGFASSSCRRALGTAHLSACHSPALNPLPLPTRPRQASCFWTAPRLRWSKRRIRTRKVSVKRRKAAAWRRWAGRRGGRTC